MWLAGETEVLGENLPRRHFVHQKFHLPSRARTRTAAVGSQRLTVSAMARPPPKLNEGHNIYSEVNTGPSASPGSVIMLMFS
jgi:hypothetical protein